MGTLKNQWLTFFSGRVKVQAEGKGLERLLNRLTRSGLSVWNVKKGKDDLLTFYIPLKDVHKLRRAARRHECRISFARGEGVPFLAKRLRKNSGFLAGALLFFAIALVLSNITWGIKIEGATPETEYKMRQELDKLGVKVGTSHWKNDHPETIQRKLTERMDNVTWVGVELKGTTFHFQVVEKNEPEKIEVSGPRELVEKKKAVIADLYVEKGKPLVKVNQYVQPGQPLVSGLIGSEQAGQQLVAATGVVWGKTWYRTTVEYPLETLFKVYSGEEKRRHVIRAWDWRITVWGFGQPEFKSFVEETDERPVHLFGWKTPFAYEKRVLRENEEIPRSLQKKEAVQAALELARMDVKRTIPEDAKIDKEYILHENADNGKVKLTVHYQVIENIAEEKPITQGD